MLSKLSLKFKIVALLSLISFSMVFLGYLGFSKLRDVDVYTGEQINIIDQNVALLMDIEQAHVRFKVQVQEWKNVLIRGNDAKQYDRYFTGFVNEEERVQGHLAEALSKAKGLGWNAEAIENIKEKHAKLGSNYREALASYDQTDRLTGQKVDKLVSGMDREASDGMSKLAIATEESFAKLITDTRSGIKQTVAEAISSYSLTVVVFLCVVLLTASLIFYDIYRVIGGEPAYAADIVRRVAEGFL